MNSQRMASIVPIVIGCIGYLAYRTILLVRCFIKKKTSCFIFRWKAVDEPWEVVPPSDWYPSHFCKMKTYLLEKETNKKENLLVTHTQGWRDNTFFDPNHKQHYAPLFMHLLCVGWRSICEFPRFLHYQWRTALRDIDSHLDLELLFYLITYPIQALTLHLHEVFWRAYWI